MGNYFTKDDTDQLVFYQVPKVLITGEKYEDMNPRALKLYIVLADRMKLSIKNNWIDEQGRYYVRMSIEKGAELLNVSEPTFKRMKKELHEYGLLEESRPGQGKTNLLYVKKCDYTDKDVIKINNEVDDIMENLEEKAQAIDALVIDQKLPVQRDQKLPILIDQNVATNKNKNNKNNLNKNKIKKYLEEENVFDSEKIEINEYAFNEFKDHFDFDQETFESIHTEMEQQGLSFFTIEEATRQIKRMNKKGKDEIFDWPKYFVGGIIKNRLSKNQALGEHKFNKAAKQKKVVDEQTEPVPFYNWLDQ